MRLPLVATSRAPRSAASAASSAALPPGPAHRSSQRSSGPRAARRPGPARRAASPRPARPRGPRPRPATAPGSPPARTRRTASTASARRAAPRGWRGRAGRHSVTRGGSLSAASRASSSSRGAAQRVAQLLDDPPRMAVGDRRRARTGRGHGVRRDRATQASRSLLGDLAQHRVGEAGRARRRPGPDQVDRGADRGVRGHPHRQQLVGAEPQRVEHLGLDLASGRSTQAARIASYVPRRRSVPEASSVTNAASRPVEAVVGAAPRAARGWCRRRRHRGGPRRRHRRGGQPRARGRPSVRAAGRAGRARRPRRRPAPASAPSPAPRRDPHARAPSRRPPSASCRTP